MFKKIISFLLVLALLSVSSLSSAFATDTNELRDNFIKTDQSAKMDVTKSTIDITQFNSNMGKFTINKKKVENALNRLVYNGSITPEYAKKVQEIVNKALDKTSKNSKEKVSPQYYNPNTGAEIFIITLSPDNIHELWFNRAGWNIIKEIINLGGGSTTIGFGIAALCGIAVSAPIAAIIGSTVVLANAAVNLQFALGCYYAILPLPY
ncbi:hypothetical protein ACETAC_01765 [Aceticella autotrophica]|uniref:Uncharacterized protein n=1 Tax=Aceticella autotrophica TaxID=2755338 RepID=A0A975GAU0_9THEO|nr:hypothetical protein [Aceticella autotrophica]QSZ27655.1 hypothetical protein ACETAC_01765 [Aceticella autotrophica]